MALAVKREGVWLKWTYAKYLEEIRTVAKVTNSHCWCNANVFASFTNSKYRVPGRKISIDVNLFRYLHVDIGKGCVNVSNVFNSSPEYWYLDFFPGQQCFRSQRVRSNI